MERKEQLARQQEAAASAIASEEARNRDILNCWRDAPEVPTDNAFRDLLKALAFEPSVDEPVESTESEIREELYGEQLEIAEAEIPRRRSIDIAIGATCTVIAVYLASNHGAWGFFCGLLIFAAGYLSYSVSLTVKRQKRAHSTTKENLPARLEQERRDYENDLRLYRETVAKDQQDWVEAERQRIEKVKLLIDGDPDAVGDTVTSALEELDFPFDTQCRVGTSDGETVYILLDLPEIEDVIPETKQTATAKGVLKEKKRTREERFTDYAHLVCGLALYVGRVAVSVAPSTKDVHVAGYTQRRQSGTGIERDDFVYEMIATRGTLSRLPFDTIPDPASALAQLKPSRIDLRDNRELKRIAPPDWEADVRG